MSPVKKENYFYSFYIVCLTGIFVVIQISGSNAQTPAEIRADCSKKYPSSYYRSMEPPGVYLQRENCVAEGIKKVSGSSARELQNSPMDTQHKTVNQTQKSNDKKEVQKSKIVPKQSSRPVISDGE